jgi:hypothetical protein
MVNPTATKATQTPRLWRAILMAITNIIPGIDQITDINHIMKWSTFPPKKPDKAPKDNPKKRDISTDMKPIERDILAP